MPSLSLIYGPIAGWKKPCTKVAVEIESRRTRGIFEFENQRRLRMSALANHLIDSIASALRARDLLIESNGVERPGIDAFAFLRPTAPTDGKQNN